ncbi:uncharacterized protein LOC112341693 [Selaginella moellendorffii]|uniref:uncharacterized protein LOC112341693 n=1 Tax=Selaginella moellendorffii TaxID=88036 RepID=UPI000D1CFFE3|nr:uncharacterized protein LOC112341693 [Selaginella moellendorffii]|eukprot:XP_024518049.1 uncharacterized protein LOC112341693 [Selaginella moellendorffii]
MEWRRMLDSGGRARRLHESGMAGQGRRDLLEVCKNRDGDFVQRFCLQQSDGYVCKLGEIAGLLESFRWDDRAENSVSWNVTIMGYAKGGEAERALELFTAMQALDVAVSSRTLAAFLQAWLDMAEKEEARLVDGRLLKVALLEKALAGRLQGLKQDSAGFCIGT